MTRRFHTGVRSGICWLFVLMAVPFTVHARLAAASAPDPARIAAFISDEIKRHRIPGLALGLVEGDQIIHLQGFGKADQTGRAVTPQTPFVLASVSKPLTALAVMQLVEASRVELDAPVQRYVPDFRLADPVASAQITVRHLLLHTSGLPVTACDTRVDAQTLAEYVTELQTVQLAAPVGARHIYCSGNYNILGRIIETVSGESYASYIQRHLFTPLQMQHSYTAEQAARQDGLAQGYQWFFGLTIPVHFPFNPSQLPSGFLIASAEDMTHFLIAQLNGGRYGASTVLSAEGTAAMQAPGVATGAGAGSYGLGWVNRSLGGIPTIQHSGDHPDFHALLLILSLDKVKK